jgi:DNA repair exonuclease SbcCD ATPase subunit
MNMGIEHTNGNGKDGAHAILLESHEERLQTMGQELQANTRATVSMQAEVSLVRQQMVEGNAHIVEKLDSGLKIIGEKLEGHKAQMGKLERQVEGISKATTAHDSAIKGLKGEDLARSKRKKNWKMLAFGVLLPALGAAGEHLGHAIWGLLGLK